MIYVTNTTDAQAVFFPVSYTLEEPGTITFTARSTVDLDTPISAVVIDLQTHDLYYNVSLALPQGLTPGEYEYELASDGVTLSSGVMVLSGGDVPVEEYTQSTTYEQYEG